MFSHFIITKRSALLQCIADKYVELSNDWRLFIDSPNYKKYQTPTKQILIIGDCIEEENTILNTSFKEIPRLKGNFYAVVLSGKDCFIFTSFLNMLPIYYTNDKTTLTSSIKLLKSYTKQNTYSIDKKFILESLLFNYGFSNRTLFQELSLIPTNNYVQLSNELTIQQHFETTKLFEREGAPSHTLHELSDLFIKTAKDYLPPKDTAIAFTSGFDGRTLVSCASHLGFEFTTFSFGKSENADVAIPKINAKELSIPYTCFNLGSKDYTSHAFKKHAEAFAENYPGGNGYIYAHFLYSSKEIAKNSSYLVSGVIGSELFRALHITGAVTSKALVDVFSTQDPFAIKEKLRRSNTLKVLEMDSFEEALNELIDEILAYKKALPVNLTPNQQFYIFVFEEVFRKFFGSWIYAQQHYINVRTPFLDYQFIKALLSTSYAGANNDFFTENPFKRMKGQRVYADIIRKTNTTIYKQKTGKGYRPKDVREPLHFYKILLPFITKRIKKKTKVTNLDNLGIISGALHQKETFLELINNADWVKKSYISELLNDLTPYTPENNRDTLLMTMSLLMALKKLENTNTTQLNIHA